MALTDDDKQWISQQLSTQVSEHSEHVSQKSSKLSEHVSQELSKLSEHVLERLSQFSQQLETFHRVLTAEFDQKLEHLREQGAMDLERVETKLLTAFHGWSSPLEMRVRSHSSVLRALDLDLENLSERVKRLEDDRK